MNTVIKNNSLALLLSVASTVGFSQSDPQDYPRFNAYPNEDTEALARHLSRARDIAGEDLIGDFFWRCMVSPLDSTLVRGVQHNGIIPATRMFDNFYSVGQNAVSAHVLETSEGLIVFDALNNSDEARDILIPNMLELGLDPADIRYVVITHGHGDHWGGARYLQDTYDARVISSAIDWNEIAEDASPTGRAADMAAPLRDIVVSDGDVITLGDTSMEFHVVPGHSPGTLGTIFPVYENGVRHMAGFHGGTGGARDIESSRLHVESLQRWREITDEAGVDVLIANHPAHNQAIWRQVLLRYALPGDPNPFIMGANRYQRYFQIMEECQRAFIARLGGNSDF
jgi:metallo-beta-lactamase class B